MKATMKLALASVALLALLSCCAMAEEVQAKEERGHDRDIASLISK